MQYQAHIPMQLTQKFLDKLGYEPKKQKIFVIRDLFTAIDLAAKNSVVFVTDDLEARDMFKLIVMFNAEFGSDDEIIYIDVENNKNAWKEFIEELSNMPKFDVAICNPPYEGDLHLNIIKKVIEISDVVVNISPVVKIINKRLKFTDKVKSYKKFVPMFKYIQSLDVMTNQKFEDIFGITTQNVMGIQVYDKSKPDLNWTNDKFCEYGVDFYDEPLFTREFEKNLIKKVFDKIALSNWGNAADTTTGSFILNYSGFFGQSNKKDIIEWHTPGFKTWQSQVAAKYNNTDPVHNKQFKFLNEQIAHNFYDSYRCSFIRWIVSLWKMDLHSYPEYIPWTGDYNHVWSNADWMDWFDLTTIERQFIELEIERLSIK